MCCQLWFIRLPSPQVNSFQLLEEVASQMTLIERVSIMSPFHHHRDITACTVFRSEICVLEHMADYKETLYIYTFHIEWDGSFEMLIIGNLKQVRCRYKSEQRNVGLLSFVFLLSRTSPHELFLLIVRNAFMFSLTFSHGF